MKVPNADSAGRFVFTPINETRSCVYDPTITRLATPSYTHLPIDIQMDVHALRQDTITAGVTCLADKNRTLALSPDRATTLSRTDFDIGQTAIYVQDRYRFAGDKASLLVGLRHDRWKYQNIFNARRSTAG